jgi:hypothetical protein
VVLQNLVSLTKPEIALSSILAIRRGHILVRKLTPAVLKERECDYSLMFDSYSRGETAVLPSYSVW